MIWIRFNLTCFRPDLDSVWPDLDLTQIRLDLYISSQLSLVIGTEFHIRFSRRRLASGVETKAGGRTSISTVPVHQLHRSASDFLLQVLFLLLPRVLPVSPSLCSLEIYQTKDALVASKSWHLCANLNSYYLNSVLLVDCPNNSWID